MSPFVSLGFWTVSFIISNGAFRKLDPFQSEMGPVPKMLCSVRNTR
jgi:hypothetical protein